MNLLQQLQSYLQNPQRKAQLEVEVAAIIDWGRPFVTATHSLEGDGLWYYSAMRKLKPSRLPFVLHTLPILMLLHAYYVIVLTEACCREPSLLHVSKGQLCNSTCISQVLQQNIIQYGTACLQPGLNYFEMHFLL